MADKADKSKEERKSWHTLSYQEQQQRQLQKLFERVDKPVAIPEPSKDRVAKPPPDVVRNVQGSSAGAGSGEFHVYRALRRKEYTRLKDMDEQEAKQKDAQDYEEKLARMRAEDEERTAKNRSKRRRKNKDNKEKGEKEVKSSRDTPKKQSDEKSEKKIEGKIEGEKKEYNEKSNVDNDNSEIPITP